MRLMMLVIVLVVCWQNPLMYTHGFQTALWTSVNDGRKLMFATGVYVGSSGGQFSYFGWQSHGQNPLQVQLV
jgi:hypothetical protein